MLPITIYVIFFAIFIGRTILSTILLILALFLFLSCIYCIFLYFYNKDRFTHLDFDILNNKINFLKVNPKYKELKFFTISNLDSIYYKIGYRGIFFSLYILFKDNKRFKIYTGLGIERIKRMGYLISNFLNKPFKYKRNRRTFVRFN